MRQPHPQKKKDTNGMAAARMILQMFEEEELLILSLLAKRRRKRRWAVRPPNDGRSVLGEFSVLVKPMRTLDEGRHFSYFGMSAQRFDDLLRRVEPFVRHERTHSSPVDLPERLAVTLRLLASGNSQRSVADSYKLGVSTVSRIVSEMCSAIWQALEEDYVSLPKGTEWTDIAQDFWRLWNFPNCVGCIDDRRVSIRTGSDSVYYNGAQSIELFATCDAHHRFTMVDIASYDCENEKRIFRISRFGSRLVHKTLGLPQPVALPGSGTKLPHVFLGDAAFPLHENLMRPYSGVNLDDAQKTYNSRHSRALKVIENTFDILVARWKILDRSIEYNPEKAVDVVKACIALHNMLAHNDAAESLTCRRYIPPNLTDNTGASGELIPGEWRSLLTRHTNLRDPGRFCCTRASNVAIAARNNLKSFFLTPQGLLPM
ncbi:putative nuclease HARBI1 [Hippoglossus stenolepis]|uniref:putative nuclease HARBI1 n=1 Tax=Hippoglossus stenolepis TaxID=195615 RepID=UPI00159C3959|nr:putative nuclease HARBI1 [Hippoglossus stenolepis]